MHSSAKPACSTSARPWATTPSSAMPRRCRAVSACRTASAITARPRRRRRPTIARSTNVPCSALRRGLFEAIRFLALFAIAVPLPILLLAHWEHYSAGFAGSASCQRRCADIGHAAALRRLLSRLAGGGACWPSISSRAFANVFLETDKTYPLYGFHYWLQTVVARFSNSRFFNLLFGDSSSIVHYMRSARLEPEHGRADRLELRHQPAARQPVPLRHRQRHDGLGRAVDDQHAPVELIVPAGQDPHRRPQLPRQQHPLSARTARTGANCLLGTKVMIPIDGPVRENVGLLGSPSFEIPRIVDRDKSLMGALSAETRGQRLRQKNVYNLVTASLFLFGQWLFFFATLVVWQAALLNYPRLRRFRAFRRRACHVLGVDPVLRAARASEPRLQATRAEDGHDLRPVFLVSRTSLEALRLAGRETLRRHAVQELDVAPRGREDRPESL